MRPHSATPNRTWLELQSLALAGAIMAISGTTLLGWWLGLDELLQPFGPHAALGINAGIAFFALGVALLAAEARSGFSPLAAGVASLIAFVSLVGFIMDRDFGIGQFWGAVQMADFAPAAARINPAVAICLLFSGLVLIWRGTNRGSGARLFIEALVGSLAASAGLCVIIGYNADLAVIYRLGGATAASPVAGVSLVLLGLGLVLVAWREHMRTDGSAPVWSPMPVMLVGLTLAGILWLGLHEREQASARRQLEAQVDQFAIQSKEQLDKFAGQLERLARVWSEAAVDPNGREQAEIVRQLTTSGTDAACLSIAFLDLSHRVTAVFPRARQEQSLGFQHSSLEERRAALEQAIGSGFRPVFGTGTRVPSPNGREKGFVIYAPVSQAGKTSGFVAAEFSYHKVFQGIASKLKVHPAHDLLVELDGDVVFPQSGAADDGNQKLVTERHYNIADRRMRVRLNPSPAALVAARRYLPELALAAGMGISILLGLSVYLARSARSGQRAAELSNEKLFGENEERRHVEERLKISEERLHLALDSTQIGIFEWSVAAGHVYHTSGLWSMFGYEPARMPSTVEAWQSLIHVDDLPLYRRRTESQLSGTASFVELEYRVRAHSGEWRWVCMRSKSVGANATGRPARIIGTVQDITARREAELALRESQSEARKLSLVAAKTDSPVLIGTPDGQIEWANEAFCRMMEYGVADVVGKNPLNFLIGTETNPRSLIRIRTAVARGRSISTDVVNYSKSGRKYYLHVEIQPVLRANGEVENFIAVGTDITNRVETERQLRQAKADADDASRAKSEFLAAMSHEIRTPMNGVIGMTSLLMDTTLTNEQRDYVTTMRTSGEALLTVINDILDFSKIESGKMELERSPFELSLCLEEGLDLFALQASAKRLELGYIIAPDVPTWLLGDATRLRQVVVNLVNNAIKFTPSGSVSVEVRRASRPPTPADYEAGIVSDPQRVTLEFAVRDTGIGIPADRLDRLFRAFSQVDSTTTRKYGGTGLGLAICRRLCQLMGGDIRVESTRGQGTEFVFTIQTELSPVGSDSGLSATPAPIRGGWVLCVESHPVTQARLRSLIGLWDVECVIVPDPASAIEIAGRRPNAPALLVVDAGDRLDGGASPLEMLSGIKCPRLALYPFGQTPPLPATNDELAFATTTKPIRNISFLVSAAGLFQSKASKNPLGLRTDERLIAEQIPLEVLLAEDNAVNQKVALRFLERLGYRADAVANGLEALTTLERRRYDLVLMDLQMPEMDGFEATRQIRRRLPLSRQPKIVALTANAMKGDRELCVAAGMDDYISKPVKIQEIAGVIQRHFGKSPEAVAAHQLIH